MISVIFLLGSLRSELKQVLKLRPSIQSDEGSIREIIDLSFPVFFRFFASHSLSSKGLVLVSETAGKIVGFVKLIEFGGGIRECGCILWLAVHPDFRGCHIALGLVEAGANYLFNHGSDAIFASTQKRNFGSLATFGKAGFRTMGFQDLWRLFGLRVFGLYRNIWYAPGEIVLMKDNAKLLPWAR